MTLPFPKAARAPTTTLGDPRVATLWAGRGENRRADRRGRRPARYRLTSAYLYLDDKSGTAPRRIPVSAIEDVFVREDPSQRDRGTGDLTVLTGGSATVLRDVRRPLAVRVLLLATVRRGLEVAPARPDAAGTFLDRVRALPEADEILQLLSRIGRRRDAGLVTEEQFQAKRAELLARL